MSGFAARRQPFEAAEPTGPVVPWIAKNLGRDPQPGAAAGEHREDPRGAELGPRPDLLDQLAPRPHPQLDLFAGPDGR
jgi:hypothetical protein